MIYVTSLDQKIYVTTEGSTVVVTTESESPSNKAIQFQDEGLNLGTKGTADVVNFVGSGVTVTRSGDIITVTVSGGSGSGDVVGPSSATADSIAVFDGTTGKLIKGGGYTIADIIALSGGITFSQAYKISTLRL